MTPFTTYFMGNTPSSSMGQTGNTVSGSCASNPNKKSSGKRKAVLISAMYYGQRSRLCGTLNGAAAMYGLLLDHLNYKEENMVILNETSKYPHCQPTKENIVKAMHWLVQDAQPGDTLFFFFGGHGYSVDDLDGDEPGCFDSVICPVDFENPRTKAFDNMLSDDDIHRYMVKPLKPGVRLTAVFDSCHSGSVMDLPYNYDTSGKQNHSGVFQFVAKYLARALASYAKGSVDLKGIKNGAWLIKKRLTANRKAEQKSEATKSSQADVVQWSACRDDDTGYVAPFCKPYCYMGVMSHAFVKSFSENPQQSYVQFLHSVRDICATEGPKQVPKPVDHLQVPQLSCSHPLDTDLPVIM
ncbi:Similar to Metacaspase-1A; acc. no. B0XPP3 [Pyronema omphalodes CBS 100304]|uniref:Similar to Metacaspase-1A acc. no. B0XPP3 n=1 Tax=Pyronema omphalodes (strain CBS 100304) TaxID=1076935 RepID=U4LGM9_PYROM|nr:Similar to Metacaspase-1A; acc. no. B0XPP3 [Pyronema omphalodes CBS 100304]